MCHNCQEITKKHYIVVVKDPGPEGLALISPHTGGCLPLDNQRNNGMLENWNVGYEKRMMA